MGELISIIVPVYNVEKYLVRCIDSIVKQTYKDIEILAVDDGSTDNSGKILDDYAERDPRIRVFHVKNGGCSKARNLALSLASGQWICFVDSDDWIELDYCEQLLMTAITQKCDVVCCGYYESMSLRDKHIGKKYSDAIYDNYMAQHELAAYNLTDYLWNKIYKRELWNDVEFSNISVAEDMEIMYKIFAKVNQVGLIKGQLYNYFQRADSAVHTPSIARVEDTFMVYKNRFEYYTKICPDVTDSQKKELVKLAYYVCVSPSDETNNKVKKIARDTIRRYSVIPEISLKGKIKFLILKSIIKIKE